MDSLQLTFKRYSPAMHCATIAPLLCSTPQLHPQDPIVGG
jgi:hypothetical protein